MGCLGLARGRVGGLIAAAALVAIGAALGPGDTPLEARGILLAGAFGVLLELDRRRRARRS